MKLIALISIAVGCLLAVPVSASAVIYTVDSTLDEPDATPGVGGCLTAGLKCTLRAAIQESNASTGVTDEILFAAAFNGQLADTVTLTNGLLPAITNAVGINAGLCATQAGQGGPCAGIEASALSYGLSVENTNTVEISGLAITGATTGIRVVNSSESFVARNNWLGEKLDGTNGSGANTGIWLDPDSDKAIIGGTAAGQGNVFVNNAAEGLDIEGASETDVMGNYFGVKADGVTKAANGKNIEITDTVAIPATDNEVGDTVSGGAAPCDGPCNVISGATTSGVDLFGNAGNEKPATGPTTIQGNYMGLSAAGTTVVANTEYGVFTGKAGGVTVGGPANGDSNFFAGLGTGIFYSSGEGFKAMGNSFGNGPTGLDLTSPNTAIFISTLENNLPVMVSGNTMRMEGGVGIEARFGGTEIKNSFIEGAELGIWTKVAPGPAGSNLIEGNVIGESTLNGLRIEDNANLVFGNSIYKSGGAGIRILNPAALVNATENRIGGDTADRENNIRESGGDAIEIDNSGGEGASQNEVGRNRGEENGGLFIDLIGALTNGAIQPPTFTTSVQSSAEGSAEPGATIRVFRKETAEPGEIESFLGEAKADAGGNWKVTYPGQIPVGTNIAATQTNTEGGTSELELTTAAADPPKDDGKKPDSGPDPAAKPVPQTKINKTKVKGNTVKFKFSSSEKGSKFECKLDKKKFKPCKSPKTYKNLKPGKHVFKVRAVKGGVADPTPAKRKFKVVE